MPSASRRLADLHVHTDASDGQDSPEAVVSRAARAGIAVIAVTDHDTISSVDRASAAGRRAGVQVVPAVEMSATDGANDVHVIAYFVDPLDAVLAGYLERLKAVRERRARRICARLRGEGVPVDYADVLQEAADGRVGRAHVARALVAKRVVPTIEDAFESYLGRDACCYVAKPAPPPEAVVRFLSDLGAAPVIAHPGVLPKPLGTSRLVHAGLVGIECLHPEHTKGQATYWRRQARQFGLVVTGGSDWHGDSGAHKGDLGSITVDASVVAELDRRRRRRDPCVEAPRLWDEDHAS